MQKLFELPVQPYWSQMDALGHVNNAVYFTYCEQARISWFDSIGLGDALSGSAETGPVVAEACCTYLRPVVYPCELIVSVYGGAPGRSSFSTHYEISDGKTLYTTGTSTIVWIDFKRGKSVPLPQKIRSLLE